MPNQSSALLHWYRLAYLGWEFRRQGSRWRFRDEDSLDEVYLQGLAATIKHHAQGVKETSNTMFVESIVKSLDETLALVSDDQVKADIEQLANTNTRLQTLAINQKMGMTTETARCILLAGLSESSSIPPEPDYQSLVMIADCLTMVEWMQQSVIDGERRDEPAELQLPDYVYDTGCRLLARSDLRLCVGEALKAGNPQRLIAHWASELRILDGREWAVYDLGDSLGWLIYHLWLTSGRIAPRQIKEVAEATIAKLQQIGLPVPKDASLERLTFKHPPASTQIETAPSVLQSLFHLDESIQGALATISSNEMANEREAVTNGSRPPASTQIETAPSVLQSLFHRDESIQGALATISSDEMANEREAVTNGSRPPEEALSRLRRINPLSMEELKNAGFEKFIACSEPARRAATAALNFVKETGPFLIVAPSGCGKEMLVRDIHQIMCAGSKTLSPKPITISCGELGSELGWTDLVGIEDKAATGVSARRGKLAAAAGGVLVLDEFHSLPRDRQDVMLRILDQDNPDFAPFGSKSDTRNNVACKIVACTSENLWAMVDDGRLHNPLLLRFGGRIVWIPLLHERPEDIQGMLEDYLKKQEWDPIPSDEEQKIVVKFVVVQKWEGRKLKSELGWRGHSSDHSLSKMFPELAASLTDPETRKNELIAALTANEGNVTKTAKSLYLDDEAEDTKRKRLTRECEKLGIDPEQYRKRG